MKHPSAFIPSFFALALVAFGTAGCAGAASDVDDDPAASSNDELATSSNVTPSAIRGRWERHVRAGVTGAWTFGTDGSLLIEHTESGTSELVETDYRLEKGELLVDGLDPAQVTVEGTGNKRKLTLAFKDEHSKVETSVYEVGSDDSLPMPKSLRGKWSAAPGQLGTDDLALEDDGHYTWRVGNTNPLSCGDENGCQPTLYQGLVTTIKVKGDDRGQLVLDGRRTFNYVVDGKSLTLTGASGTSGKHSLRVKSR